MFLKPSKTEPPLPGHIARDGGTAWVDFVGDQPVFTSEGTARFVVERFRPTPFKPKPEAVPQGRAVSPIHPLRKADRVRLDIGDETLRWAYDPDANLGRPMRIMMSVAELGTSVCIIVVCFVASVELAAKFSMLRYGDTGDSIRPVATEIRAGYAEVYQKKPLMSEFLKGMIRARKQGEDPAAFAARWKEEHPVTKASAETEK